MDVGAEISRLMELMPASGRMYCKLVSGSPQSPVILAKLPRPGQEVRPIAINFTQWQHLSQPQRDLLLLQAVAWLTEIRWFKPNLYQGLAAIGVVATLIEGLQTNTAGVLVMASLTTVAAAQIWRKNRSAEMVQIADEKAIQVAQRRGYTQSEAVQALIGAIETLAQLEGRSLNLNETLRCQRLRAIEPIRTSS